MVNVLVTGGAGYIGSHVCKALCKAGMTPVALDNLSMGHRWAVKWGPLEVSDLGDRARLDEILAKYRPKSVIHLAGSAYVGESMTNPWKYYRNNVVASLTLFEAMRHGGVTEIVFSSTCSTYGLPASVPITEASPQKPINPYGKSKLMIEQMLADFQQSDGMRHLSLRYFNAAGADPDGEIGELHEPETHLIPILLQVASGQRDHRYSHRRPRSSTKSCRVPSRRKSHVQANPHVRRSHWKPSQSFDRPVPSYCLSDLKKPHSQRKRPNTDRRRSLPTKPLRVGFRRSDTSMPPVARRSAIRASLALTFHLVSTNIRRPKMFRVAPEKSDLRAAKFTGRMRVKIDGLLELSSLAR